MLLAGLTFAALMGLVGGFFPARKAATRAIVEALREA
jgi:ABC-type antimicrobial peptide transport system permease subunit